MDNGWQAIVEWLRVNERMRALLDRNEREEREMMFKTVIDNGWKPEISHPGMLRKELIGGYMIANLDDAYDCESKQRLRDFLERVPTFGPIQ